MRDCYKYQCNFNASHSFDGDRAHEHNHTFIVVLYMCKNSDETMDFDVVEDIVDETFFRYEGSYLNELVEFTDGASVEAIGNFLFEVLRDKLAPRGLTLVQLDIGDNPLSMYQIGCEV